MPFYSLPTGGSPVLAGSGAPTGAVGNVGDLFLDQSNKMLYGPKTSSGWPSGPIGLSNGPTGVSGPTGSTGGYAFAATGPTAPVLTTTGAIWLDDSTGKYFVRYGSLWVEVGIQGETGATGSAGANARGGINVQAATGTVNLNGSAEKYQFINATNANRTLKLPTGIATGFDLFIKETGDAYTLAVETTTATGVANLGSAGYSNKAAAVIWDGTIWRVIYF